VRNDERYLAFSPAVSEAFLEVSDLRRQFFLSPSVYGITRGVECASMCEPPRQSQ
jgi:hypothetical protein